MPERPRSDRLLRDELLLYQRRALRSWCESDWLAEHDPVAWRKCDEADPGTVCIELCGGALPSEAGAIAVGTATEEPGRKGVDLHWSLAEGLPFEDRTLDEVYVGADALARLDDATRKRLPKWLARVLRVGGSVTMVPPVPMAVSVGMGEHFDEEDLLADGRRRFVLGQGKTSLEQAAPLLVDETNMGERVIREPRTPIRR